MSSTVERLNPASRSNAAHAAAADLVQRGRKLNSQLDAYFREVVETKRRLKDEGSLWDGPAFEQLVEAAHDVWTSRGPRETRVELDRVGPVPMMELEEDGYPDSPA
jgi:hypothetical protein